MSLLKGCAFDYVEPEATAGTSTLTSDILDMQGYEGVVFIVLTGDATSGTVLSLQAKSNTANSTSGAADITGALATYTSASASDADNKFLIVDVYRPVNRYVYATLTRATQNCVVNGIIAIRYGAHAKPVTQPASVVGSTFLVGV